MKPTMSTGHRLPATGGNVRQQLCDGEAAGFQNLKRRTSHHFYPGIGAPSETETPSPDNNSLVADKGVRLLFKNDLGVLWAAGV